MRHNIFDEIPLNAVSGKDNVFANFLQTDGLYDFMEINEDNIQDLILLLNGNVRMSVYCKECKTERVFTMSPYIHFIDEMNECYSQKLSEEVLRVQREYALDNTTSPDRFVSKENTVWKWKNWQIEEVSRILVFKFVCSMNDEHHLDYIVSTEGNRFRKIGQYPSVAVLTFPELDVYKKVMSNDDRKEFGRAIGLYASGIGVGSYVYLRRILERLLEQAKQKAGDGIDIEAFEKARVGEKITILSSYLPSALTSNAVLYSILSKGIHELTEEECLVYFPVLKDCLYMILDQWEEMRKKEEKEKSINAALSKIATNIK